MLSSFEAIFYSWIAGSLAGYAARGYCRLLSWFLFVHLFLVPFVRMEWYGMGWRLSLQARIFREIFMPVELSPVEFMQLMDLAQRRVVLAGNDINQHGRPHKEMFLIVEGTAEVRAVGKTRINASGSN